MSQQNVEIVRESLDAFNAFTRGELEGQAVEEVAARISDPQVEWHWHDELTTPDIPQYLRGVPTIIEVWERYSRQWTDLALEALEFIDAPDDRVVTPMRQSGRERESGVSMELHFFDVWTIRDRKVRKLEIFRHRADALEAAGLRG
jgi:ketosteroid isomerase-like protein